MKKLLFVYLLILTSLSFSFGGDRTQNGGGECDERIPPIIDELKSWVLRYDSTTLNLPGDLEHGDYREAMYKVLDKMELSCTDRILKINNRVEKTCLNTPNSDGSSLLECNRTALRTTSDEGLYKLIHHEAAGMAGFETNNGNNRSNYFITSQLAAFTEKVTVTRLAIRPVVKYEESSEHDHYSISGVYRYRKNEPSLAILATLTYDLVVPANEDIIDIGNGENSCEIKLANKVNKQRVLKRGEIIKFFNTDSRNKYLLASLGKVVINSKKPTVFHLSVNEKYLSEVTVLQLKQSCNAIFEIKEKHLLEFKNTNNTNVYEIFKNGMNLKATLKQNLIIKEGTQSLNIWTAPYGQNYDDACYLNLKKPAKEYTVLKAGKSFIFRTLEHQDNDYGWLPFVYDYRIVIKDLDKNSPIDNISLLPNRDGGYYAQLDFLYSNCKDLFDLEVIPASSVNN